MASSKAARLLTIAQSLADREDFQSVRGPGDGDRATLASWRLLRQPQAGVGQDTGAEDCGSTLPVDFYFRAVDIVESPGLPSRRD